MHILSGVDNNPRTYSWIEPTVEMPPSEELLEEIRKGVEAREMMRKKHGKESLDEQIIGTIGSIETAENILGNTEIDDSKDL